VSSAFQGWIAPPRQKGVAIVTALVVIAAATVLVSGMLWRQSIMERKVENRAAMGQARWLARSALDWARLVLLQDALTSSVDHYGEAWAIPLQETRVSDPDESSGPDDVAYVSGRILDAQARFNLTDLAPAGKINEQELAAFARLVTLVGGDDDVASTIAQRIATAPRPANYTLLVRELKAAHAVEPAVLDALAPYVIILPKSTPVNLNTASAEVLMTCFAGMSLDQARAMVQARSRAYFNQVSDASASLAGSGTNATPQASVSVTTEYFEAHGHVRYGRVELDVAALIHREAGGATKVIEWDES
jgi:general secretion pathway protein K